jgi:hypothetical protein
MSRGIEQGCRHYNCSCRNTFILTRERDVCVGECDLISVIAEHVVAYSGRDRVITIKRFPIVGGGDVERYSRVHGITCTVANRALGTVIIVRKTTPEGSGFYRDIITRVHRKGASTLRRYMSA